MAASDTEENETYINCNLLNVSHEEDILVDKYAQIAVPIVFGLILVFGLIGNGSVILIVLKSKQMRTIPNIYLLSLAMGDFLLLLFAVPFSAFVFSFPSWKFGETLCKVNFFLETLSLGVSVFTLTLLGIDRYLAISHPMRKRSGTSMKKTIFRASAVWVVSLCLAIPDGVSSGLKLNGLYCVLYCDPYRADWGKWYIQFHVTYRFLLFFALPVLIITVCYCLMARTLISSSSHILVEVPSKRHGPSKTKAGRTQVAKIVLSFVVVFILCWLPRHVYLLIFNYDLFGDFTFGWYVFKILSFCLAFVNSCMNPIALYLQSEQFRKYFCRYLCRYWHHRITRSGTDNAPTTLVTQCHYTKGMNEDSSSTLLKVYNE